MPRPRKDAAERKATYFRFRLTEAEKRLIEAAAASRSLDASAWARSELLALARRVVAKAERHERLPIVRGRHRLIGHPDRTADRPAGVRPDDRREAGKGTEAG